MSPFQTAQMFSLADPNIHNLAIEGVFDDCQDIVKAVGGDAAFKARHAIGTVNSINWARVAAQIVYYFKGYFAVARAVGDPVDFAVPSGNFGNILAGHVAKRMGLPIRRLILATNENDVLDEFFRTGRYRPRGTAETHATSSPSMDISKASNFERYVFDIVGRDPAVVRELWTRIAERGRLRSRRHAALAARRGVRLRVWNEHPRRPDRDDPRHLRALQGRRSTRTRPTASAWAADSAIPRFRSSASRPRCRRSSRRRSARRSAAIPNGRPPTPISSRARSGATCSRPTRRA